MGPKEAAQVAKKHVLDLFGDEGITDIGLEEIEMEGDYWKITIGFSRKWGNIGSILSSTGRAYKVLKVNIKNKTILSVKDRNLSNAIF